MWVGVAVYWTSRREKSSRVAPKAPKATVDGSKIAGGPPPPQLSQVLGHRNLVLMLLTLSWFTDRPTGRANREVMRCLADAVGPR